VSAVVLNSETPFKGFSAVGVYDMIHDRIQAKNINKFSRLWS